MTLNNTAGPLHQKWASGFFIKKASVSGGEVGPRAKQAGPRLDECCGSGEVFALGRQHWGTGKERGDLTPQLALSCRTSDHDVAV